MQCEENVSPPTTAGQVKTPKNNGLQRFPEGSFRRGGGRAEREWVVVESLTLSTTGRMKERLLVAEYR